MPGQNERRLGESLRIRRSPDGTGRARFGAGGDDYMVKPFSFEELLARLRVMLRRAGSEPGAVIGGIRLDPVEHALVSDDVRVDLTPTEFRVLAALAGLELTDYTATQRHVHIYHFPAAANGGVLSLRPGESAFVFSRPGTDRCLPGPPGQGELHLYAGRHAPVWNNTGDVAYLRTLDGRIVDSMTVGHPARQPNGH
jgi:hypothetical protein